MVEGAAMASDLLEAQALREAVLTYARLFFTMAIIKNVIPL
jgi:hypothetical protein